ncbi:MAG: Unknown protein [uncultured Thiotrichaceae bacterium]|uniref:DUF2244 domain-containing protein n=1 Tax=uncultured Thiotrichaceae bacterium TaxID=298394 RepID=A0A6S6T2I4_9GAMM|nr:MAG: Unknown protein [uncultured Thiotrichaceae bacterium]
MPKEFIIQPNCSLSKKDRHGFFWLMGVVMAGITLTLALKGMWLVAPFMGADLLLLIYAFRKVGEQCRIVERVIIENDELIIHHEEKRAPRSWSFPLHWVSVDLQVNQYPQSPSRLLIGSHGNWVELATFLNEEERISLAGAIKTAIIKARQPAWVH